MKKRQSLISSFGFAFNGLWQVVRKERNIKVHLFLASLAILLGLVLGITRYEWLALTLTIFMILGAEIFNATIEGICDLLKEKLNLDYQATKDIRNASGGGFVIGHGIYNHWSDYFSPPL